MIEFFKSELLGRHDFPVHGFTKRGGGVSGGGHDSLNLAFNVGDDPANVVENLKRLKDELKIDSPLLRVSQVHGNRVVDASECAQAGKGFWFEAPSVEADGIVGIAAGEVLAVQSADCAPVLLADPKTRTVAALHAGWRGAARGIVGNGIRAMVDRGADKSSIIAAIGPCACGKCYEVGEEVARRFPESSDEIKGKPGKYLLDLGLAVEVSLIGAGLSGRNIDRIDACTMCRKDELYSRRRDGEETGRFLGFISARSQERRGRVCRD